MSYIEFENVCKDYPTGDTVVHAADHVSFTIEKGELCVILGHSGAGKTVMTCALLAALKKRGLDVRSFKCGPDYIDPMFHERVIGSEGSNLDLFFYSANTLRYLLAKNAENAELV